MHSLTLYCPQHITHTERDTTQHTAHSSTQHTTHSTAHTFCRGSRGASLSVPLPPTAPTPPPNDGYSAEPALDAAEGKGGNDCSAVVVGAAEEEESGGGGGR